MGVKPTPKVALAVAPSLSSAKAVSSKLQFGDPRSEEYHGVTWSLLLRQDYYGKHKWDNYLLDSN